MFLFLQKNGKNETFWLIFKHCDIWSIPDPTILVNTRLFLVSFFDSQNVYISIFFYHHPNSPAPDETVDPKSVAKVSIDKMAPGIRPLGSPE